MNFIKKLLFSFLAWFGVCVVVTLIIFFVGTIIFPFNFTFRSVFWPMLIACYCLDLILSLFLSPWQKVYKYELSLGKTKRSAFEAACEKVKYKPPRAILKFFRLKLKC